MPPPRVREGGDIAADGDLFFASLQVSTPFFSPVRKEPAVIGGFDGNERGLRGPFFGMVSADR